MAFVRNQASIAEFKQDGDSLIGKFITTQENKKFPGRNNYLVEKDNGERMLVFGCDILAQEMLGIEPGTRIKIVYKGTKKSETKGHKDMKLFEVYKDVKEQTSLA